MGKYKNQTKNRTDEPHNIITPKRHRQPFLGGFGEMQKISRAIIRRKKVGFSYELIFFFFFLQNVTTASRLVT
jgi:hypothetical protein